MKIINISKDFTDTPGGRHISEGKYSGEEFRESLLKPLIEKNQKVKIELDGTFGYPVSFLEEAFGGLSRKYGKNKILELLSFVSDEDPELIEEIVGYIEAYSS